MITILSPSKTLTLDNQNNFDRLDPSFLSNSIELVEILKKMDIDDIKKLMKVSNNIAELNLKRFKEWKTPFSNDSSLQAIFMFKGDVYDGLNVNDFSENEMSFLNDNIRIISGLYGILRPLDNIMPYRLEMGRSLRNKLGNNLYKFWASSLADKINSEFKGHVLLNLASDEYSKAVINKSLELNVITPVFKDCKNGEYKVISFYAKKARGMMARFIAKNKVNNYEKIKDFKEAGYYFSVEESTSDKLIFLRDEILK